MSRNYTGPDADLEDVIYKYAYYRVPRDVFYRLKEKRARGETINFKERGGDHVFTMTGRELTPDELRRFAGTGYFLTERLFEGKAEDWLFFIIEPDVQVSPAQQPATGAASQPAALASQPNAAQQTYPPATQPQGGAHESVLVARELVGLSKDLTTPAPSAPTLTREDVARMLDEKIDGLAEKLKPATPAPASAERPRTLVEQAKEIKDAADVLGISAKAEREPAQREEKNPGELFLDQLEMFTNISERLGPKPEGGGGLLDTVASLAEGIGRAAEKVAPHLPKMITAWGTLQQMKAGQQPQANGAQPGQAQPQPGTLPPAPGMPPVVLSTLNLIALDARRDAPVNRAADAIESAANADAELAEMLEQIKATPSALLVEQVAQLTGHAYLTDLPHVCAWFDALREELKARAENVGDEESDGQRAEASDLPANNGHRGAASVAPSQ